MKETALPKNGFTLLEVLVAITVSSILFTVLLGGFSASIKNTSIAEGYTTAAFLAKEMMTRIESEKNLASGISRGDFGDDYPGFRWESQVKLDIDGSFYTTELKVVFAKSAGDREVVIRSVILK